MAVLRLVGWFAAVGFMAAGWLVNAGEEGFRVLSSPPADSRRRASPMTQGDLESALLSGQPVIFSANATILLTNTIIIRTNATIDGSGGTVVLDGQSRVRHFVVTNGATFRLKNVSLVNGAFRAPEAASGPGVAGFGGAVYQEGGVLELTSCTFSNNIAMGGRAATPLDSSQPGGSADGGPAGGGALFCLNAQVAVTNCVFTVSQATGGHASWYGQFGGYYTRLGGPAYGGALFSSNSVLALVGVTFSNNATLGGESTGTFDFPLAGGPSSGGALAQVGGTGIVSRCLFAANTAQGPGGGVGVGGAVFHDAGRLRVAQCTFKNNAALGGYEIIGGPGPGQGGSASAGALMNKSGTLEVFESAIVFNRAEGGAVGFNMFTPAMSGSGDGGGIENWGELLMVNCTMAENEASAGGAEPPGGGRGWAQGGGIRGNATLINVTLARNHVDPVGGFWSSGGANVWGDVLITNTILYCLSGQSNFVGHILGESHNLCSDDSASLAGPGSYNDVDPLLGPVADNGGVTETVAISPRSPAVNAGDPDACPETDQRGFPRPAGAGCDLGAFELTPTVNLQRASADSVRVGCLFEAGSTNRFEVTDDFLHWAELGTAVADADGQCEVQDPAALQKQRRFYRVVTGRFLTLFSTLRGKSP